MTCRNYLVTKINSMGSSLVDIVHHVLEGGFKRQRLINPDPVSKGQEGPTGGAAVGEGNRDDPRSEGVEFMGGVGVEEREELVSGWASGPCGDQGQ